MDLSQKTSRALERTGDWLAANSLDLVLAILAALLIALALMALRSFGDRLVADRSQDLHWRAIFGRVLSRTSTLFILIVAIEIVAHNAATPPRLQNAMDIAFTIAATLQGAVWLRELILGILQHRLGEAEQHSTVGTAVGLIRGLVTAGLFAIALVLAWALAASRSVWPRKACSRICSRRSRSSSTSPFGAATASSSTRCRARSSRSGSRPRASARSMARR
jgi:hypothetical protein